MFAWFVGIIDTFFLAASPPGGTCGNSDRNYNLQYLVGKKNGKFHLKGKWKYLNLEQRVAPYRLEPTKMKQVTKYGRGLATSIEIESSRKKMHYVSPLVTPSWNIFGPQVRHTFRISLFVRPKGNDW